MHRDRVIILLLAGAAITGGCRREREQPAPPVENEAPSPIAIEQSTPPPDMMPPTMAPASAVEPTPQPVRPEVPTAPRLVDGADLPFAICAVTEERDGTIKVGVVDKETGASGLLRVGQTFGGYELVSYDEERETGVFKYGGEQIMVGFSAGPASDGGGLPAEPTANLVPAEPIAMGGPPLDRIDLRGIDQNNMEPTAKEKEQGIDPHDPATWPKGYRGPVIERLLQRQKDAGIKPEESPIPLTPAQQ